MARIRSAALPLVIGRNVRRLRMQREWSQEALAEQVGLTPLSVSRLETGRTAPSIAALAAVAEALGVRLGELVDPRHEPTTSSRQDQLVAFVETLNEEEQGLALAASRAFINELRAMRSRR